MIAKKKVIVKNRGGRAPSAPPLKSASDDSPFNDIISGILQGSVVAPILFSVFFNDFFFFMQHATVHNFAEDNILSNF